MESVCLSVGLQCLGTLQASTDKCGHEGLLCDVGDLDSDSLLYLENGPRPEPSPQLS